MLLRRIPARSRPKDFFRAFIPFMTSAFNGLEVPQLPRGGHAKRQLYFSKLAVCNFSRFSSKISFQCIVASIGLWIKYGLIINISVAFRGNCSSIHQVAIAILLPEMHLTVGMPTIPKPFFHTVAVFSSKYDKPCRIAFFNDTKSILHQLYTSTVPTVFEARTLIENFFTLKTTIIVKGLPFSDRTVLYITSCRGVCIVIAVV